MATQLSVRWGGHHCPLGRTPLSAGGDPRSLSYSYSHSFLSKDSGGGLTDDS
jgi:hypothetical protein